MGFTGWYITLACGGAALLCLYWAMRAFWLWRVVPNWPRVDATIAQREGRKFRPEKKRKRQYALDVNVTYRFHGQEYTTRQPIPGGLVTRSQEGLEAIAKMFETGATVRVYVNPNKPREAYTVPVAPWRIVALLVCVLCFAAVAVNVLYDSHPTARLFIDQHWPSLSNDPTQDTPVGQDVE